MAEYLQLGPNDYIQFPDGLDAAGKQAFATRAAVAYKTQQAQQVANSQQADLQYAQQNGTSLMGRRQAQAQQILQNQTTPEQVLNEQNPITNGLSTAGNEIATGAGETFGPGSNLVQRVVGLARMANAPAAGLGQAAGTTTQKFLANAIPAALGGGAAGVIPAAGAALADAGTQLVTGPASIRGAMRTAKSIGQGALQYLMPGAMREAGMEAIAGNLGQPMQALGRIFNTPASKAAYNLAQAKGAVPTADLADTLEQTFFKHADLANPNNGALRYISNVEQKFRANPQLAYGDVMDEIQALKARADSAFNSTAPEGKILGQTLMQAREHLINELDNTSPIYREANRLYRQEQAVTDIMNATRSGAPGFNLNKLLENNPDIAKSFSRPVIKEISDIADKLNSVASATPAGGFRQFIAAAATPLTNMMASPMGRAILRSTLTQPSDKLPRALTAAVQTYKALTPRQQGE